MSVPKQVHDKFFILVFVEVYISASPHFFCYRSIIGVNRSLKRRGRVKELDLLLKFSISFRKENKNDTLEQQEKHMCKTGDLWV